MNITLKGDGVLLTPEDDFDRKLIHHWSGYHNFSPDVIRTSGLYYAPTMELSMYLAAPREPEPEYINGVCCG